MWHNRMTGALFATCFFVLWLGSMAALAQDAQRAAVAVAPEAEDLRALQMRLQTIAEEVAPTVVKIRFSEQGLGVDGSGVVIDKAGLVLTHGHHDREIGGEVAVRFLDGTTVPAEIVRHGVAKSGGDWSLVRLREAGPWPAARLRLDGYPEVDERCFHMGYPGSQAVGLNTTSPMLRLGSVVAAHHSLVYAHCLAFSGDSGGPLFDLRGRVLGIAHGGTVWSPLIAGSWVSVRGLIDRDVVFNVRDEAHLEQLGLLDGHRERDKNRGIPTEAFERAQQAQAAVVEVAVDGVRVGLGTVVRADGLVVTKRSLVMTFTGRPAGRLTCTLADGRVLPGKILGDVHEHDIALLGVEVDGLTTAPWCDAEASRRGTIVAALGASEESLAVGAVSVHERFPIDARSHEIGFLVQEQGASLQVSEDPDADYLLKERCFGWPEVRAGDTLVSLEGLAFETRKEFFGIIEGAVGGDLVEVRILQGGEGNSVVFPTAAGVGRAYESHNLSRRRWGFPVVIGHDAVTSPDQCGGPLIDLDGRVLGINIARYANYQTLAVPHDIVRELVSQMIRDR